MRRKTENEDGALNASSARAQALILVSQIRNKLDSLEHTLTLIERAQDIHEVQGRGRKAK